MENKREDMTIIPELTPVVLMCDFVDVGEDLERLVDSPAFLPVCNIPLIQHALDNIIIQGFTNIFFCIKSKETKGRIQTLVSNLYLDTIRATFVIGHDYGTIMRSMDDIDYGFETFLIYPVNFITNFVLKKIIVDYHYYKKKDKKIVMNIYMFDKDIYSDEIDLYGFNAYKETHELLHYEKTNARNKIHSRLFDTIRDVHTLRVVTKCCSPRLCVVGKEIFALFSENYDYQTMDCLLESSLAINLYKYRFLLHYEETKQLFDLRCINESLSNLKIEDDCLCKVIQNPCDFYEVNYYFKDNRFRREELMELELFYNKVTYEFREVGSNLITTSHPEGNSRRLGVNRHIRDSVIGCNIVNLSNCSITNCIINHEYILNANIENCIAFDGCVLEINDSRYIAYCGDETIFEYETDLQVDHESSEDESSCPDSITFHSEILSYLEEITQSVISKKIEISDVKKQVNLIAIVWKANSKDLIDVFTIFLGDFIDQDDLNQSTIEASMFFPIIEGSLCELKTQESFIYAVYKGLNIENKRLRKEAFVRIGYAMMDDGLIEKDILNSTNIIKGNFFQ